MYIFQELVQLILQSIGLKYLFFSGFFIIISFLFFIINFLLLFRLIWFIIASHVLFKLKKEKRNFSIGRHNYLERLFETRATISNLLICLISANIFFLMVFFSDVIFCCSQSRCRGVCVCVCTRNRGVNFKLTQRVEYGRVFRASH